LNHQQEKDVHSLKKICGRKIWTSEKLGEEALTYQRGQQIAIRAVRVLMWLC